MLDAPVGVPPTPPCTALASRPLGSASPLRRSKLLAARREDLEDDELEDDDELCCEESVDLARRWRLRPDPLSGVPELMDSVWSACDDDTVMMVSEVLSAPALAVAAGAMAAGDSGEAM